MTQLAPVASEIELQTGVAPEHVFTIDPGSHTATHAPPSQVRPVPDCASVVHCTQVPATQVVPWAQLSGAEVQEAPGVHTPFLHVWLTSQAPSSAQETTLGAQKWGEFSSFGSSGKHDCSWPQFALLMHGGATGAHWLLTRQVCPAGQTVFEQS